MRKFVAIIVTLIFVLGSLVPAFACTATVIGKDVAADRNPIIARTEDWSSSYNKTVIDATLIYKELNTFFFDMACDQIYKEDYEKITPYVPSLLGEQRLEEIYQELGIPLEGGSAQPLEKPGEVTGSEAGVSVILSSQRVMLDGAATTLQGYLIDGYNYYKLRDLAAILAATEGRFNVEYKESAGKIEIEAGGTYIKSDDDLSPLSADVITAKVSSQKVSLAGEDLAVEGYNIDGYNYFKLRDIAEYLNFDVKYEEEENTVLLVTK